jgi:hypothetical protein
MGAVAGDVAAERRGAAALDDAQELALPARRRDTGGVGQQHDVAFDVAVTCAALRGERALPRRGGPQLGRELDPVEGGEVQLESREARGREDDGIHGTPVGELAHPRRHVASQRHGDGLGREVPQQGAAPQ